MSIYRFSGASAVKEIAFRHASDRPPVALLTAAAAADAAQLSTIRRAIESQGWQCVPATVEGREILQASGFEDDGQLSRFLVSHHFTEGKPKITAEPGDDPTRTTKEWLQHTSLKAVGWLNLLGDLSLLAAGVQKRDGYKIAAGSLYTAGAATLARYGNVKTEHQVRQVLEKTAQFLKQQAGALPEDCGLFSIAKQKREGLLPATENFFYRYPSEVFLGAYTLGASSMLLSGIKQGNPWSVAYGANSVATKAASLLIPEKQQSEKEEGKTSRSGPLGKCIDWIQEKPLRVFGFGSMLSDTLLGLAAYRDYRHNPKQRSYIFDFVTTGMYLTADVMAAISNKNQVNADGRFDREEQRRIEAMAAEVIARKPKFIQDGLIHQVSGFLATQPEMQGTAGDISQAIKEQVLHMGRNPWTCRSRDSQIIRL